MGKVPIPFTGESIDTDDDPSDNAWKLAGLTAGFALLGGLVMAGNRLRSAALRRAGVDGGSGSAGFVIDGDL